MSDARTTVRPGRLAAWAASFAALVVGVESAAASCTDAASCQVRLLTLVEKLGKTQETMKSRRSTMVALESFRDGLMRGERVDLPSAQRQHLEKGSPLVGEVSYDAKHRPVSTNVTRSMRHIRTIAEGSDIRQYGMMPVKKPFDAKSGGGSTIFVASLQGDSKLSLHTPDGEARLTDFDLGHKVTHMSLPSAPEHSYVFTGDASGKLHVLMVEFVMRNATDADAKADGNATKPKKVSVVVANTTAKFTLPSAGDGRKITSVLSVDRGSQPLFVVGDSHGSIAVFFKNGTIKGRMKVTEDAGGVLGLLRGQGQTVLYHTSHSFGFFSVAQIDVMAPPCIGWNSPIFDIAPDPLSTYAKVIVALEDGNVLVFATSSGKSKEKSCDLTLKFPRISALPFRLHNIRGHVMGLPTPLSTTERPNEHNRELYFFNLNAMEAGYGTTQSRVVTLQASFEPRRLESFALLTGAASPSANGPNAGPKVHLALQFTEQRAGLELYELNLKTPAGPVGGGGGGGSGGSSGGSDIASWLDWIPKVGIFGVTLIGVVIWNVRKVSGKSSESSGGGGGGGLDGIDEDLLRSIKQKAGGAKGGADGLDGLGGEKLEKLLGMAKAKAGGKKKGAGSGGGLGDLGGLGDMGVDDLAAQTKQMEDLLASMGGDDD